MLGMTVNEIREACDGKLLCGSEKILIRHISFDSRKIQENTLYVPLIGERTDGHQYIKSAFQNGADATLTSHQPEIMDENAWIYVDDTRRALQAIAACYRSRLTLPIVGITGSVGKTTVRAMTATALSSAFHVFETKGNQNSQVSVPIMLTEIEEEKVAVLEMGMSEAGEMERLTKMVRPNIAVITCIGTAHIEQLKTKEAILKEKMSISQGMTEKGILILNGNDELLRNQKMPLSQKVYYFGTAPDCDFRAENIENHGESIVFDAVLGQERVRVELGMPGEHNMLNALAALSVCWVLHAPLEQAAKSLKEFHGVKMRQKIYTFSFYTLIDDSYNANPDSMKAGLKVLMEYPTQGRKIAVLGDMFELGENEADYHREIGKFAAELGVDLLYVYGELANKYIADGAIHVNNGIQVVRAETKEAIIEALKQLLLPEDTVFIKASRGMQFNEISEALIQQNQ